MTQLTTWRQKLSEDELMNNLAGLFQQVQTHGDGERAKKFVQLIKKVYDKEYSIGFCGHFSAGKSSMINYLAGGDILPSSPIPTSANLVKVRSGEEVARVHLFNGEIMEFPAPYDMTEIKNYCMDGNEVEWIEIGTRSKFIPEGVTILDTPGIDSVDEAHRIATESALHLADIILYMMDYNHVQSEISFHFTKKLQEMNKPLYLIINQIDKHQESELSFSEFKQGVINSFKDWGVKPEGIFYTSVRAEDLLQNELSDLKSLLSIKWDNREENLLEGVINSAHTLIQEHISFLHEKKVEETERCQEKLSHLSFAEKNELTSIVEKMQQKLAEKKTTAEDAVLWIQKELNKLLDSAYVMPFETRELAKAFLESEQPEFKVGFLFSKQKTETERNDRLHAFYEAVMEKVESQIDWHIKDLLSKFHSKYHLPEGLKTEVYDFKVHIEKEELRSLVKKGAKVTGDAVLHFTNDIANECKKKYRKEVLNLIEQWQLILSEQVRVKMSELEVELEKYEEYVEALQHLTEMKNDLTTNQAELETILTEGSKGQSNDLLESMIRTFENTNISTSFVKKEKINKTEQVMNEEKKAVTVSAVPTEKINPLQMVSNIERVTNSLKGLIGTKTIVKQLVEKASRLQNQSFTIALFGAFSAGKSSFANALMGTKLLPVSPNPTTATINKIKPITEQFPHGTVRVQMKDNEQLKKDLLFSLKFFDMTFNTMSEGLRQIEQVLKLDEIEPRQKPHYSFLKAVYSGYEFVEGNIGNLLLVGLDDFKEFVASEEKSCFVEWIEVYYDCPLTRQGITLVDTPGADSINARHTGVAFEYIKNADAILFVTYYNHAFSKADREFLIQLGRVKDAFELDKMFFLINAADLASSEDELLLVEKYVTEQLITYGIRNPRIYPVSSQLAVKEKTGEVIDHPILQTSGINEFEEDFSGFIEHELTQLTITSARLDLNRVSDILKEYIETALISNEQKVQRKTTLKNELSTILSIIQNVDINVYDRAIEKEAKELLYYVKQRVFLRFTDMFNESFHPSVLSDDSKNIKKTLSQCLEELLEFVSFDLSQELRATSVRLEAYLKKQVKKVHEQVNNDISKVHEPLQLSLLGGNKIETIEFSDALKQMNREPLVKIVSSFKNAKTFFEKNGKKIMRDEIEASLQSPVGEFLEECSNEMTIFYINEFSKQVNSWKSHSETEIQYYFDGLFDILSEKMNIEELQAINHEVTSIIQ